MMAWYLSMKYRIDKDTLLRKEDGTVEPVPQKEGPRHRLRRDKHDAFGREAVHHGHRCQQTTPNAIGMRKRKSPL